MLSSSNPIHQDLSLEDYYLLAITQSTQISQQLQSLIASSRNTELSQEQRMSLESQYNIKKTMFDTLNRNIQSLTSSHPQLLVSSFPSGSVTGDHHNPSASSGSTFSFANASQITFHPGVNSQASAKHEKHHPRSRVTRGR